MRKNKLLLLLALLLTAATGAWADETPLLTIESKDYVDFTSGSKTFDDKVTVTFSNSVLNNGDTGGWFTISASLLTVAGTNGYTITSCKFYTADGDAMTGYTVAGESPSVYLAVGTVYTDDNQTVNIGYPGIKKIEVFGAAATAGYTVSMKDGVKDADKWTVKVGDGQAQALPIGGLKGDGSETVTLQYNGRLKVKGVKATSEAAAPAGPTYNETKSINDGPVTVAAGEHWLITGTGTQTSNAILIAAGATVTLDGVNISSGDYCIKCLGDATIILKDGSTNTLTGTGDTYPALWIGDANTTLTIQGSTGVLNVTSGQYCAGIGGGYNNANQTCGNIRIEGGVITAQGGEYAAGIGTDSCPATCGDIIITGGTITAKGGGDAAGIGSGASDIDSDPDVCGAITIANTVTKVTATKGANAPYSIGKGDGNKASCGTVTIGGTKYWENNAAVNGGDTYLATSPLIYDPAAPAVKPAATVTTAPTGAAIVGRLNTNAMKLVSGGVADGGTLMYKVQATKTKPPTTVGFSDEVPTAQTITASGKVYVWYYVKGDDTHTDSEIAATPIVVPVADIVWDATNVSGLEMWGTEEYEVDGVKLSGNAENISAGWVDYGDPTTSGIVFEPYESGGYTFTAPTGKKFTKIEMKAQGSDGWYGENLGTGWAYSEDGDNGIFTVTWTGSAASTDKLLPDTEDFSGAAPVKSIAFYLSK